MIETLVYLALLGLVFSGLLAAGFAMIESLDALKTRAFVQEEINFLDARIDRILSGATAVSSDATSTLEFESPVASELRIEDGFLKMDGVPLNSSAIRIGGAGFAVFDDSSETVKVTAGFEAQTLTPRGRVYEQNFDITDYLQK